jgi:hypothetical protein
LSSCFLRASSVVIDVIDLDRGLVRLIRKDLLPLIGEGDMLFVVNVRSASRTRESPGRSDLVAGSTTDTASCMVITEEVLSSSAILC